MNKSNSTFEIVHVKTSKQLEVAIQNNIEQKSTSHFLIVNEWDKVCSHFLENIPKDEDGFNAVLYVINIFDVPNALGVMRSSIRKVKDNFVSPHLSKYDQLPMLVILHKAFPRVITYNKSVGAELGL